MSDIKILQDVTEDLHLTETTRIEGKISPGVLITSDDPEVGLSVMRLTPMVEIDIAGDFSSPYAQNVSIEANSVDIEKLRNVPYTHTTDSGEEIKMRGFSHISAEESIVIDDLEGTRDYLNKDNPSVAFDADVIVVNGKKIEGHWYPEQASQEELDAMPTYEGHGQQGSSKTPEVDMEALQARLDKLMSGPKISKVQVADLAKMRENNELSEPEPSDKPQKSSLQEKLDKIKEGPRISAKNVLDYVTKDDSPDKGGHSR